MSRCLYVHVCLYLIVAVCICAVGVCVSGAVRVWLCVSMAECGCVYDYKLVCLSGCLCVHDYYSNGKMIHSMFILN